MNSSLERHINQAFDRHVTWSFVWRGHVLPAFQLCATIGLTLAIAAALTLAAIRGLSVGWMTAALAAGGASSFMLALGYKIVTGEERLVFLHHVAVVIGAAAAVLYFAGQAIIPYIEIVALCFGILLAIGRIGCLCAGCCHGRPHDWGVRYGTRYVEEGFSTSLEGVRLLPVPLFEGLWVGAASFGCIAALAAGAPTGLALASFAPLYAIGRFACELLRGDSVRTWWGPLSQAQWLCLALCVAVLSPQLSGTLASSYLSLTLASAALALFASALAFRGLRERLQPFHPSDVDVIADAVHSESMPAAVDVRSIPRGWRFSRGSIQADGGSCLHWAVSGFTGEPRLFASLIRLLLRLEKLPRNTPVRVSPGQSVTHILVFPNALREELS